jgi:hypothetical protein
MIEIDAAPYENGSRNELYIFTTASSNFLRRRTSSPALIAPRRNLTAKKK